MRAPLSGRGALLGDFGIGMAAALGGKPRRARIDALGRNRWPSAGASLDLDFVNRQAYVQGVGVCTPADVITFSGGAGGTRVNSVGQIVAASGLRYNHDPITMACKGLLIEEQRTNLLKDSGDQTTANWLAYGDVASIAKNLFAPDGTLAGSLITEGVLNSTHGFIASASNRPITGAVPTAASIYIKPGTRRYVNVSVEASGNGYNVTLDTTNGALTVPVNTGVGWVASAASAELGPGGWYRLTLVGTPAAAASSVFIVSGCTTFTSTRSEVYAGNGSSWGAWGAQLEAGSFATSYIPTTSAAVTRTADAAQIAASNFAAWFNGVQGCFVVENDYTAGTATQSGGASSFATKHTGGASYNLDMYARIGTADGVAVQNDANVVQFFANPGPVLAPGVPAKGAFSYAAGAYKNCVNGSPVISGNGADVMNVQDVLWIGSLSGSASILNGHIKRMRYWPRQFADSDLQALTA
jgi:hypothetical protein